MIVFRFILSKRMFFKEEKQQNQDVHSRFRDIKNDVNLNINS